MKAEGSRVQASAWTWSLQPAGLADLGNGGRPPRIASLFAQEQYHLGPDRSLAGQPLLAAAAASYIHTGPPADPLTAANILPLILQNHPHLSRPIAFGVD